MNDFYEDDEPIEKIMAIFEREPQGATAPPVEAAGQILPGGNYIVVTP